MTPQSPKPSALKRGDQSFDDRAVHLQKNIYGSAKGQLRLRILQRDLSPLVVDQPPLQILDAGCGTGLMSEWALSHGHYVSACDSAAVMVDEVRSRLGQSPRFDCRQTSIQALADNLPLNKKYDLIFCHAVLEWVEDQPTLLDKLSNLLAPNGTLSLMFYNAWAREMAQLVYGNFDYIDRQYVVRQRVKLSPHYPAFPDVVEQQLTERQLKVNTRSGIRIFYDIMRQREHQQSLADDIMRHELRISQQYPYWQMGRYVHFLATKS